MSLSLVIATRRRPEALRATLASLRACDPLPAELVVVDGDEAGSAAAVVAEHAALPGAPPSRHVGSAPGLTRQRNVGLERAAGDVVVFADDDVEFDPRIFAVIARAHEDPATLGTTARISEPADGRIGAGASRLRHLLGRRQGTMTAFGYPRRLVDLDRPRDVEFMHGCLMSVRREVGLAERFDERLAGYGLAEDEDFGYRVSRRGRVRYLPDARVVHVRMGSGTADARAFNRMLVHNRSYLFRKNFPQTGRSVAGFWAMVALLGLHRLVNGEPGGVLGLAEGAAAVRRAGGATRDSPSTGS